jgi:hypothetical protein
MPDTMKNERLFGILALFLVPVFLFLSIGGDLIHWMSNQACYTYFGCNLGFFGYDALVHFTSGMTEITLIIWLTRKSPAGWRHPLVLIALAALIGVSWEFIEYCFDHYRMLVLHENLLYPINTMTQPTNSDTMGDLTFGIIGAAIMTLFSKLVSRHTKPAK